MSAEKPEVGDVWEDSKGMVHISRIFTLSDDTRAIVFIDNNNNTVLEDSAREEHFIKMFTYSGKSKASVNDLFQTEQDVANNVAKPTLQHLQAENNRLKTTLKNLKSLMLDPDCVQDRGDIYVMVRAIDKALIGESEER
jgi:hypothetical protein